MGLELGGACEKLKIIPGISGAGARLRDERLTGAYCETGREEGWEGGEFRVGCVSAW